METIVNGKFVTEVLSVTEIILSMCVCVCVYMERHVTFMEAHLPRPRTD